MAKLLARRVMNGEMTLEYVREHYSRWYEQVKKLVEEANGDA